MGHVCPESNLFYHKTINIRRNAFRLLLVLHPIVLVNMREWVEFSVPRVQYTSKKKMFQTIYKSRTVKASLTFYNPPVIIWFLFSSKLNFSALHVKKIYWHLLLEFWVLILYCKLEVKWNEYIQFNNWKPDVKPKDGFCSLSALIELF